MIGNSINRRWRLVTAILAAGVLGAMIGCGDDEKSPAQPPVVFSPPTGLTAAHGDGEITLTWAGSPDESWSEFRRYNLYRSTSSLLSVDPTQLGPYLVQSANPGVHNVDTTVTNGTLYYYHLRGERTNGVLTAASNEISAAGRPDGSGIVVFEFAATGNSGFGFADGRSVSLDSTNEQRFALTDLYHGTSAADDASSGDLRLKSPHLLGAVGYRNVGIKILGTDWTIATTTDDGWADQAAVVKDLVYAVRIPATGTPAHYAKLQLNDVKTTPPGERTITLRYAYQSGADLILF
jgi:hypothetical protein